MHFLFCLEKVFPKKTFGCDKLPNSFKYHFIMILPRNLLDENIMKYQSINNFTKVALFLFQKLSLIMIQSKVGNTNFFLMFFWVWKKEMQFAPEVVSKVMKSYWKLPLIIIFSTFSCHSKIWGKYFREDDKKNFLQCVWDHKSQKVSCWLATNEKFVSCLI